MTRSSIGGKLDMAALARLSRTETEHRPDDPAALRREAEHLLSIGLSIQDVAQALDLLPGALAQLLGDRTTPSTILVDGGASDCL
jgi:hypothetical protein